jgi:TM2 domain-containing membrane protein YozV
MGCLLIDGLICHPRYLFKFQGLLMGFLLIDGLICHPKYLFRFQGLLMGFLLIDGLTFVYSRLGDLSSSASGVQPPPASGEDEDRLRR